LESSIEPPGMSVLAFCQSSLPVDMGQGYAASVATGLSSSIAMNGAQEDW
jgi:hypothetical protein